MKKLTALLLALTLTLTLTSCTPDDPAPTPDPTAPAETYIAELRSVFTAAGIQADPDADPASSTQIRSTFTYDETTDPPTLESVELYYSQIGHNGVVELASAAYAAVVEQHGEPNGEHAVPAYSIQSLLDQTATPDDEAAYFDWWILSDRTLTLNIRFLNTRPSTCGIILTLE